MITISAARKIVSHAFPIQKPIDCYSHLPYHIHFRAIVSPKAAWVNEHSLQSSTSARALKKQQLSFLYLRKMPWFYTVRDWVTFKTVERNRMIKECISKGKLRPETEWRRLPSGREVLLD